MKLSKTMTRKHVNSLLGLYKKCET